MKAMFAVLATLVAQIACGQGTILFRNLGDGLDAPVRAANGELVPTNSVQIALGICRVYVAELLVGDQPTSVAPAGAGTVRLFSQPGYFGVGDPPMVLPGFPSGSHPWFMVRVMCYADFCVTTWQVPGEVIELGLFGPFQLDPAGPGLGDGTPASPAPLLHGLQSFRLKSFLIDTKPWISTPRVFGTNVVLYWGGARTVLQESFLERSSWPQGPWMRVTNARVPHVEPYDSAALFFRVVTWRTVIEAAPPALAQEK